MTRIEAENFSSITNFVTTSNPDASGGALITLFDAVNNTAFPPGTASTSFNQPTGTYEVIIGTFDEIDGEGTIDVTIGSTVFPTITLNNPTSTASGIPEASSFVPLQISPSTFIRNGDLIEVKGTADGEEFIRFDYIEFNLTNELPVAVDDTATTTEDTTVNINVLDNDTDTEGDSTLTVISDPSNGSAVVNDNGTPDDLTDDVITYTPNPNYNGPDSFTYQLNDGVNPADTATVNVTVTSVNDAPEAGDDTATTDEDIAISINVLDNDIDIDGDSLSVTIVSNPSNGNAVVDDNGTQGDTTDDFITYTPNPNTNGNDSFTYQVDDGNGGIDTATVNLTITPVNEPPEAGNDSAISNEDTAVNINVLDNDSDIEGDSSLSVVSNPSNGSAVVNTNNTPGDPTDDFITYIPDNNYNGSDSFTYQLNDGVNPPATATVNLTINPVNDAPEAGDDSAISNEDIPVNINVLDNDNDIDGDSLNIAIVSNPSNGNAVVNNNGTPDNPSDDFISYTPNPNTNGNDSFTYQVNDGNGGIDTATVNLTINPVNDAPEAGDDSATTDEDTAVSINVLENDIDIEGDSLTLAIVSNPSNGSVVVNNNGTPSNPTDDFISYTPNPNTNGNDSFSYQVNDGNGGIDTATVNLTINPVNDLPEAGDDTATTDEDTAVSINVLGNDIDIDGDSLTLTIVGNPSNGNAVVNNNGTQGDRTDDFITYTPNPNTNGNDSLIYQVDDGNGGIDTATVNLTINPVNDPPEAQNDSATTNEDTAVNINVLNNDSDIEGDSSLSVVTNPSNGSAVVNTNNTPGDLTDDFITYSPNLNYNGTDSFTYQLNDGVNPPATATVNLTINPVNDAPEAVDDSVITNEDTAVTFNVLANDSDAEGNPLTLTIVSNPSNGIAVVNDNGTPSNPTDDFITYTPNLNANGSDSLTYQVDDGNGGIDTATVNLTINPVNDPPIALDNTVTTDEDIPVNIDVINNDTDPDGDSILTVVKPPNHGTAVVNDNGTPDNLRDDFITYISDPDYNGPDSFAYRLDDGVNRPATAIVNLTVTPVNDSPFPVDDTVTTTEDTAVNINVLENDSDPEQDSSLTIVSEPRDGTAVVNDNGTPDDVSDDFITYTPNPGYNGSDSFAYRLNDGVTFPGTAVVNLEVTSVNEIPEAIDDTATTTEDTTVTIDVLDNDSDRDGDPLTLAIISNPSHGTAFVIDNNTPSDPTDDLITYTPNPDYNGSDQFTYLISDRNGGTNTATLNLNVTPVNDPPEAVDDTVITDQEVAVTIDVVENDTDPEGDLLSLVVVSAPSNGTAVVNNNGTLDNINDDVITYTPNPGFSGTDSFIYQVYDGKDGLDTATVDVTVNSIFTFVPSTLIQNPNNTFVPSTLTQNANNTFTITGDSTGNAQLLFTFISGNATNVNEIGVFVTDDDQGTVNGIAPGQEGYVEAALSNAQTIFSVLLNPEDSGQTTRLINNFDVGDQLGFYLVQNSTREAVLAGQNASVFFGDASFNSDALDHIQAQTNTDGVLTLNFEDADDQDFDDLVVTVQDASALTPTVGIGSPQIQGQVELLDLTDVTGTVTPEFVVSSQAVFQNSFGFYQVDDASGKIGNLNPGDAGYAELAVSNQVDLASGVSGGVLLAPFLIANGTVEEFLTQNPTNQQGSGLNAYFSFLSANPDQFDHVRLLGDNQFSFEDTFGGGDLDYDDLVVEVIF
ncbi:Ig-like domain-containing protein [Moorena producens]|uniref:Ig-like domain-containing protein n=1 Tax=Moorena producens TaxID=1155739 RepID=UPI003C761F9D